MVLIYLSGLDATVLEPLGGLQNDIARQLEVPFESSAITVAPKPSMLILLSLGTFLVRRRRYQPEPLRHRIVYFILNGEPVPS